MIIRDISEIDDLETSPKLLTISAESDLPLDAGLRKVGNLIIKENVSEFKWHDATPIESLDAHVRAIYSILESLATALEEGSDIEIQRLLNNKHTEIGGTHGLSRQAMDEGLLQGLAQRRENAQFRVDLVAKDDFLPLLSSDRCIVNALRKSGGHALKMIDGRRNPGFSVSLAMVDNIWSIMR